MHGIIWFLIGYSLGKSSNNTNKNINNKVRRKEDILGMKKALESLIGKECSVTVSGVVSEFRGVITEVTEGALVLESKDSKEIISLYNIVHVKELVKKEKKRV